eukprot:2894527-Pyramimonas_sp.AAC.1
MGCAMVMTSFMSCALRPQHAPDAPPGGDLHGKLPRQRGRYIRGGHFYRGPWLPAKFVLRSAAPSSNKRFPPQPPSMGGGGARPSMCSSALRALLAIARRT